jgi:hypothetical protein
VTGSFSGSSFSSSSYSVDDAVAQNIGGSPLRRIGRRGGKQIQPDYAGELGQESASPVPDIVRGILDKSRGRATPAIAEAIAPDVAAEITAHRATQMSAARTAKMARDRNLALLLLLAV